MKTLTQKFSMAVATLALAGLGMLAYAAGTQTLTGEISDSMCGAKHAMPDKAACTRACIKKGSKYALVSGDKVYTIESSSKSVEAKLNALAGENAKVTGTVSGETISATKVVAAK